MAEQNSRDWDAALHLRACEALLAATEVKLAEVEDTLADALHASLTWIFETGADLRFINLIGHVQEITGLNPKRLLGQTIEYLMIDRGDPQIEAMLGDIRGHKPYRDFLYRISTPGGLRYIRASGSPRYDSNGRFCGYRGTARDVTAQLDAENRAAATYQRFAEAIESIPASLMLFDADDRIVICNDATKRYFPGAQHLLVPGTRFEDLLRADIASGNVWKSGTDVEKWIRSRMKRHRSAKAVLTGQLKGGRWIQVIERRTSDGGTIGIRMDITKLKRKEQQLKRKAQELEEHSRELQRSNTELEQFAYVASHDLQEPLRMVASYCQLLQRRYRDKLDQDAGEFIAYAVEGASRMQRLINDLLSYSRVGRKGGAFEPLAAADLVKAALANLQGAIADSAAHIDVDELPRINGERTQLVQLFQNLIGNAIKFRREEPPRIRITSSIENGFARFIVADNGIGIEREYVERVFLIFQRLHERSRYPGTGIGLAIAKKVIDRHGGRIWIESVPGRGSQFQFTLPLASKGSARDA
ncbi:MAG: PAS-domain containing protein [Alphaproteobacteria bacterium]|nr:PAS-domain containing protein [Alphaproteobacteria bacterium]MBV9862453.1 PAS-domain containing protein [Alphaproteobacteria bacterium]